MSSAVMTYRDEDSGTEFRWHGGEYIDVGYTATEDSGIRNSEGIASHEAGDFVALDVINVWDHGANEPRIPRTLAAFEQRCREHLAQYRDAE